MAGLATPPYVIASGSHSAQLFRQTLQSFLGSGGVIGATDLKVEELGTPAMKVQVTEGQCFIPGTLGGTGPFPTPFDGQGSYYSYVPSTTDLTIAAAGSTNPRIDVVVASVQDSEYAGSNNQATLQVVTGTAAVTPVAPTVPASSVVLAHIRVGANVTSITTADITDERQRSGTRSAIVGTSTGPPTSGSYAVGTTYLDSNDNLWVCTAGGTPGTWTAVPGAPYGRIELPTKTQVASGTKPAWRNSFHGGGMAYTTRTYGLVVPYAGRYRVSWHARVSSLANAITFTIAVGGAAYLSTPTWGYRGSGDTGVAAGSDIVTMASGQLLNAYATATNGAGVGWAGGSTWLSADYISP